MFLPIFRDYLSGLGFFFSFFSKFGNMSYFEGEKKIKGREREKKKKRKVGNCAPHFILGG